MRVVVPHVGVHSLASRALDRYAPGAERIYVGHHEYAYRDLIAKLWKEGESFLLVEHDVEIHGDVLRQLLRCEKAGEPWCLFGYPGAGDESGDRVLLRSLGCTRFGAPLLRALPSFMEDLPVHHWTRLDGEMYPRLTVWRHEDGSPCDHRIIEGEVACPAGPLWRYQPHVHTPNVGHHHWRGDRCDCGSRTPHEG